MLTINVKNRIIKISLFILMMLLFTGCDTNINKPQPPDHSQSKGNETNYGDENPDELATLLTKVMSVDGYTVLLAGIGEDAGTHDLYSINTEDVIISGSTEGRLTPGMKVEVYFDGAIMESYPMGLGGVSEIHIMEEDYDLVSFYLNVMDDLWKTDPGLNDQVQIIGFDLTKTTNLLESEKAALIWLAADKYNMQTIAGTFDELSEQGYINKEQLYWEDGVLLTLEVTEDNQKTYPDNRKFTFDLNKWRSGTGAYFFIDCEAIFNNGEWSYKIGSQAIS